jgi:hypothetical protein
MKTKLLAIIIMTSAVYAGESEILNLFTVSELNGNGTRIAEGDKVLDKPVVEPDGIKDSSFIQCSTDENGVKKYFLAHNTGQSNLVLLESKNNWVFIEYLGHSIFTYVICFDHKFPDGSYLVLHSGSRVGVLGETSIRSFSGKAKPSPLLQPILEQSLKEK